MSTLRISQQSRAVSLRDSGGDKGRTDTAGGGASFTVALSAAGVAPNGATGFLTSDNSNGGPGSAAAPRKRDEDRAKAATDAAATLAAQTATVASPVVLADPSPLSRHDDAASTDVAQQSKGIVATARNGSLDASGDAASSGAAASGTRGIGGREAASLAPPVTSAAPAAVSDTGAATPVAAAATSRPSDTAPGRGDIFDRLSAAAATLGPAGDFSPKAATESGSTAGIANAPAPGSTATIARAPAAATSTPANAIDPGVAAAGQPEPPPAVVAGLPDARATNAPQTHAARLSMASAVAGAGLHPAPASPGMVGGSASPVASALAPGFVPAAPSASNPDALPALAPTLQALLPAGNAPPAFGRGSASPADASRGRLAALGAPASGSQGFGATAIDAGGTTPPMASAAATAPSSAPAPSVAPSLADQVSSQVVRLASHGSGEMVMRLHPPELGELTLRIAVTGRDVSAWFGSPQPQVQTAINAALGQLQVDLGNAGFNLNGAWVGADSSGARQQADAPPQPRSRASAPVEPAPAPTSISQPPASGVNFYA